MHAAVAVMLLILPQSPQLRTAPTKARFSLPLNPQGEARESLGHMRAEGEEAADDASRAAREADERLKKS